MQIKSGVIDKEVLRRFHVNEATSAFVAALDAGISEDELIENQFEAQVKRQLSRKAEEIPEQIGSQS
jgi:hypothetical protein